jgi:hypothetical protein
MAVTLSLRQHTWQPTKGSAGSLHCYPYAACGMHNTTVANRQRLSPLFCCSAVLLQLLLLLLQGLHT